MRQVTEKVLKQGSAQPEIKVSDQIMRHVSEQQMRHVSDDILTNCEKLCCKYKTRGHALKSIFSLVIFNF